MIWAIKKGMIKMNDKALLNEFSNVTVATIYSDRVELDGTLYDRLGGSGFYPEVIDSKYYIMDECNDDELTYLADDLADALKMLNDYDDYFNYYPNSSNFIDWEDDREPFWMTDFEYSLRSADDFKDIVDDMQDYLKEGIE